MEINAALVAKVENKSIRLPIKFYPETGAHHSNKVETLALLDSGAGGIFIDRNFQESLGIPTHQLSTAIKVRNVDGTLNKTGFIRCYVVLRLTINDKTGSVRAHVTGLGKENIILGYPWLRDWNPDVNWKLGSLRWRDTAGDTDKTPADEPKQLECCERKREGQEDADENSGGRPKLFRDAAIMSLSCQEDKYLERVEGSSPNEEGGDDLRESPMEYETPLTQEEDQTRRRSNMVIRTIRMNEWKMDEFADELYPNIIRQLYVEEMDPELFELRIYRLIGQREFEVRDLWIKKTNAAQVFAQRYTEHKKENLTLEQQIPKEYHEYLSVFSKEKASRLPEHKPWDHRIDLKPGFVPKAHEAFLLPLDETKLAEEFVKENLQKGYIRTSKSPQSSPFFFVNKKDGGKRPCQDY